MGDTLQWIGYAGLTFLSLCWIPQVVETIKRGTCPVNLTFLLLSAAGSFCLCLYAIGLGTPVFIILNAITTLGAVINIFYKFFPRKRSEGAE